MFVTYDKAPGALRDQMKKIGGGSVGAESQYRFLLVDGFSLSRTRSVLSRTMSRRRLTLIIQDALV